MIRCPEAIREAAKVVYGQQGIRGLDLKKNPFVAGQGLARKRRVRCFALCSMLTRDEEVDEPRVVHVLPTIGG